MFAALYEKFLKFSSRYTYRQRFFFWVFLYFSFTPIPAYWILETLACYSSRAALQLQGNQSARPWFTIYDAFMQYYVEWIHGVATGEIDENNLDIFKRIVQETLDGLKAEALAHNEVIIRRISMFTTGKLVKNNLDNVIFLETIWNEILKNSEAQNIEANEQLYELILSKLTDKLHQIAYDYHIVLQTDKKGAEFAQVIYFLFVEDQKLMARLSVALEKLKKAEGAAPKKVENLVRRVRYMQRQLEVSRLALVHAYQAISDESLWDKAAFNRFQRELENCYQNNMDVIDIALGYLSGKEVVGDFYITFVKGINCISRSRQNAMSVFDALIKSEYQTYTFQTTITYVYLGFIGILLMFFIAFRFLTRHFTQMESYINGLAKGKFLTITIPHPEEEMGAFALVLQNMGKSIESIVHQLEGLDREVARASEEIELTAKEQSNAVDIQGKFLLTLDENMGQIAAKTRSLADTMKSFTMISADRLKDEAAQDGVKSMLAKIRLLKDASTNILKILAVVHKKEQTTRLLTAEMTKISDQASLLALNAAIEALNVGENAQPFHDITEKIQKFSTKTSSATQAIKKIVNEMAQSVSMGRTTAESCVKEINYGANRVIEVAGQLKAIVSQDSVQYDQFHIVDEMIQNQAKLSGSIIASVSSLNTISADNKSAANNLYKTILSLGSTADELRNVVDTLSSKGGAE